MRRNGVGIGARKEKGRSEKRVKRGGRKEIGDRIFRSLDVCGSQKCIDVIAKTIDSSTFPAHPTGWLANWLAGWLAGCQQCIWDTKMRQKTRTLSTKVCRTCVPLSRKSISNRVGSRVEGVKNAYPLAENASKTRTLR